MAMNKLTKAIKLIMSHYKDILKRDGLPVKEFHMVQMYFRQDIEFYIKFSKKLSHDNELKLKKRVKEFASSIEREHNWLECDPDYTLGDDGDVATIECEVHYPKYSDVSV